MALLANVSYSKKVPAETEYSSQGYSLGLQTEIPDGDPEVIRRRLREAFDMVRQAVEDELAAGNGRPATNGRPTTNDRPAEPAKPRSAEPRATNRQIGFINALAQRRRLTAAEINARVRERFGVEGGMYDLTKSQASMLLDEMNAGKKAA
jgi:hypothetical protein